MVVEKTPGVLLPGANNLEVPITPLACQLGSGGSRTPIERFGASQVTVIGYRPVVYADIFSRIVLTRRWPIPYSRLMR